MGYTSPAQALKFMTSLVDAVESWVENTKARQSLVAEGSRKEVMGRLADHPEVT